MRMLRTSHLVHNGAVLAGQPAAVGDTDDDGRLQEERTPALAVHVDTWNMPREMAGIYSQRHKQGQSAGKSPQWSTRLGVAMCMRLENTSAGSSSKEMEGFTSL